MADLWQRKKAKKCSNNIKHAHHNIKYRLNSQGNYTYYRKYLYHNKDMAESKPCVGDDGLTATTTTSK